MSEKNPEESLAAVQRLKRWIRPVMWLVAGAFVVGSAVDLARRWDGSSVRIDVALALAALVPVFAGNVLQGIAWVVLVERMAGKSTPRVPALTLYLESQLARYTPGKVGLPLVRMEGAPRIGLSRRVVGSSVLIEMLSWIATGAVVGFLFLSLFGSPNEGLGALAGPWELPLLGAAAVGVLLLTLVDRRRLPPRVREKLALEGEGPLAPAELPIIQLVYWSSWGLHGYLLSLALGASTTGALMTAAFSPLANVLGFVALAAPAGVGVREAVLSFGLAPVLGAPGALAAAILSRLQSLLADVAVWLALRALSRRARSGAVDSSP